MERPILFSTPMVKAILEGRKTQTRRVTKPQAEDAAEDDVLIGGRWKPIQSVCPYGQVGDRLWVRGTHYRFGLWVKNGFTKTGRQKWTFRPSRESPGLDGLHYQDNSPAYVHPNRDRNLVGWFKRPSIFMPRWASRITLEITAIRVERVQDISEEDAGKEGIYPNSILRDDCYHWIKKDSGYMSAKSAFRILWDSINAKRGYSWADNPWVWVIEFRRIEQEGE
jgi:hypothetical protein